MAFGVILEGAELFRPRRLHLVQPRLQRDKAGGPKPVETAPGVVDQGVHLHQAAPAQHAEVAAEGGAGHLDVVGQVAGPARATPQHVDYPAPGGVGQGGQRGVQIINDSVNN